MSKKFEEYFDQNENENIGTDIVGQRFIRPLGHPWASTHYDWDWVLAELGYFVAPISVSWNRGWVGLG